MKSEARFCCKRLRLKQVRKVGRRKVSKVRRSFFLSDFTDFSSSLAFRYISNCFFLQYFKIHISHLSHDGMKAASFFIAVLAFFVKV